jgi:hypothetical protein
MRLMDVSSRVATGLEYSEMRLYDLAMSYSGQLHSRLGKDEPKAYQAFTDTYSPSVYKDIHSLFWELAVLRDVLAEFIAVFCLKRNDATTLSGVLRSLKNTPSNYDMRLPRIPTGEVTELRGPTVLISIRPQRDHRINSRGPSRR